MFDKELKSRCLELFGLLIVAAAVVGQTDQPAQPPGDITGYYACSGTETSGKAYHGVVTITRRSDVYIVTWSIGEGSSFVGIGVRVGDRLSVGWATPRGDGSLLRGVNTYKIEASKSVSGAPHLAGRWATMPGRGDVQSEVLAFIKALPADLDEGDGEGDGDDTKKKK